MKIVLVGYMGSGKSSVGKKLSKVLKLPFKDLDSEIEKIEEISISKIFSEKGEIYFRKVENRVLKKLLSESKHFILATGGGTPCYGDSMEFITAHKDVVSIYLKTSLEVLVTRLKSEKNQRPLLAHLNNEEEIEDFIRKHLFERAFYYNQANVVVENSSEDIAETVEKVILKLL
ncbi:shikimate kinase [Aequorivita lipolytica]|uniref:Shikimate kinase n=1 Tax=Aequorivita lipolytica TaxID=153267 RepID=A0A5C6YLV8_9FLAO|nr:shikimate kinase [Aequorivita lipolytica]TXD67912.1 AAA family ATPase [Aequorivita lipolytica]SRX53783.1 Shikimate kinase [Aequorivita lipolytica]